MTAWVSCASYFMLTISLLRPKSVTHRSIIIFLGLLVFGQLCMNEFTDIDVYVISASHAHLSLVTTLTASHCCLAAVHAVLGGSQLWRRGFMPELFHPMIVMWIVDISYRFVMLLCVQQNTRCRCAEDAGQAMESLLNSRFDAVVEVDEALKVTYAPESFFNMLTISAPRHRRELSPRSHKHLSSAPGEGLPAGNFPFREALRERADQEAVENTLKALRHERHSRHEGHDSTVQIAKALNVTLGVHSHLAVRHQLFCSVWCDSESSCFRFFLGICALKEVPVVEGPAEGAPALQAITPISVITFMIDANVPDLALLAEANLDGVQLPVGTPLSQVLVEPLFGKVRTFLLAQLEKYAQGLETSRVWRFGEITSSKFKMTHTATCELISETAIAPPGGALKVILTLTDATMRSAGSSRSSLDGLVQAELGAAEQDAQKDHNFDARLIGSGATAVQLNDPGSPSTRASVPFSL